jgi:hypothetical protein
MKKNGPNAQTRSAKSAFRSQQSEFSPVTGNNS